MLVTLGENGIKTLDDLADLSSDELIDPQDGILRGTGLSSADANSVIMAARAHWFADQGGAPVSQKATE
jgi:N utilization substance protein A